MTYHQETHPIHESKDTHPIRKSSDEEIKDKQHEEIEIR
jgi:hypothetical protein